MTEEEKPTEEIEKKEEESEDEGSKKIQRKI